jgi:hypothetical protein
MRAVNNLAETISAITKAGDGSAIIPVQKTAQADGVMGPPLPSIS